MSTKKLSDSGVTRVVMPREQPECQRCRELDEALRCANVDKDNLKQCLDKFVRKGDEFIHIQQANAEELGVMEEALRLAQRFVRESFFGEPVTDPDVVERAIHSALKKINSPPPPPVPDRQMKSCDNCRYGHLAETQKIIRRCGKCFPGYPLWASIGEAVPPKGTK